MKKVRIYVAAVVSMLMANMIQANTLEEKLVSKINEMEQASFISDHTRFLTALAQMQQNAVQNRLDKNGVVQGAKQVVDSYLSLAQNHGELYMLEQQTYLNRRIALGGVNKTIAAYLISAANKQDARNFKRAQSSLDSAKHLFKKHYVVISEVAAARAALGQIAAGAEVAQAQAKQGNMSVAQYQQIDQVLEALRPLARALEAADESFWPIFSEGMKQDPFTLKDGQALALPEFLAAYGRLAPIEQDGILFTNISARLKGGAQEIVNVEEGISAHTHFLTALAQMQQNAIQNRLDKDGVVQGAAQVADSYLALAQKHSELFMLEQQTYLNRRIALGGVNKTIAAYLINKSDKKNTRKFDRLEETLRHNKRLFNKYQTVITEVAAARAALGQIAAGAEVAQAQSKQGNMSVAQYQQIDQVLQALRPLANALEVADESFWPIFSEGMKQDPFTLKDGQVLALPEFLAAYGRLAPIQKDGVFFVEMAERLQ